MKANCPHKECVGNGKHPLWLNYIIHKCLLRLCTYMCVYLNYPNFIMIYYTVLRQMALYPKTNLHNIKAPTGSRSTTGSSFQNTVARHHTGFWSQDPQIEHQQQTFDSTMHRLNINNNLVFPRFACFDKLLIPRSKD